VCPSKIERKCKGKQEKKKLSEKLTSEKKINILLQYSAPIQQKPKEIDGLKKPLNEA